MIEHPVPEIRFHTDCRIKKTDSPEKTAKNHGQNDPDHRQADLIQQHIHGEHHSLPVDHHFAAICAIDHHAVELRHLELKKINQYQCSQPE